MTIIKALHTVIFATVGGAIALVVWDGLLQSPGRRTVVAGGMIFIESAIYASNNQVCPLTPLAEQLGARRGTVADIYLPEWLSRRIPVIGGSAMLLGLGLNARAALRRPDVRRRDRSRLRCLPPDLPQRNPDSPDQHGGIGASDPGADARAAAG